MREFCACCESIRLALGMGVQGRIGFLVVLGVIIMCGQTVYLPVAHRMELI
jgi:preprotein translocase subunit Sss1